jgi:hypothetical protein
MDRLTWLDMHGPQGDAPEDNAVDDATRFFDEEYPKVRELFGDLIEVSLCVTEHWRGATVKRTDTGVTLAEYDLD